MRRFLLAGVWITASLSISGLAVSDGAVTLRFEDDRGQTVADPLEVCFQKGTVMDCQPISGNMAAVPAEFQSMRVEGPNHGPVLLRPLDLRPKPDGRVTVVVPRKVELEIRAQPGQRLTVSLYSPDDPTFRHPSFRQQVQAGESLKVPSGPHLVSLTAAERAPDLKLLDAPPGKRQQLTYAGRTGWSLVFRCLAKKGERALQGATVRLAGEEDFASDGAAPIQQVTENHGLVLFSGISHALATVVAEHPSYTRRQERGISASPGTFTFRQAELEEGGILRAAITLAGRPARKVACQILEIDPNPRGPSPEPHVAFEGETDGQGICQSNKLPAGPYTLRLRAGGGRSFTDRSVTLVAGETTAVGLALNPIHVAGKVSKGMRPAKAYIITLSDVNELKPNATRRDAQAEATTDEEGTFETLLWAPGDYVALLRSPEGIPAASRELRIVGDEEELNFQLEENGIAGVVTDERGSPVARATVQLEWNLTSFRLATTDARGAFDFAVTEPGEGKVKAMKAGYLSPEPVAVTVHPEAVSPPLVIQLRRGARVSGQILSSRGPAAGASIQSYQTDSGGQLRFLDASVVQEDGAFEIAGSEKGAIRLFVTGSGCPLSVFSVQPSAEGLVLRCSDTPSSLELTLEDSQSKPIAGRTVFLLRDGALIPAAVLIDHLSRFRIPAATDGSGHLYLVGLAPGHYDLYLADITSPELIALGVKEGLLTSAYLAPFATVEFKITVD